MKIYGWYEINLLILDFLFTSSFFSGGGGLRIESQKLLDGISFSRPEDFRRLLGVTLPRDWQTSICKYCSLLISPYLPLFFFLSLSFSLLTFFLWVEGGGEFIPRPRIGLEYVCVCGSTVGCRDCVGLPFWISYCFMPNRFLCVICWSIPQSPTFLPPLVARGIVGCCVLSLLIRFSWGVDSFCLSHRFCFCSFVSSQHADTDAKAVRSHFSLNISLSLCLIFINYCRG